MSLAESGPDRIEAAFKRAGEEGRSALMPYLVGGFPDPGTSREIAAAYVDAGADLVEIGIPYSDPLADGPVIQDAATAALSAGVDVGDVLSVAASVPSEVPVVLLAYAGLVIGGEGPARFARRAVEAGVAGVIVPDLPLGTDEAIRQEMADAGLAVIPLVAPTTPPGRRSGILEGASGFVYLVSDVGTTGERSALPESLASLVREVSEESPVPVAVGFGIGTPEQAAEVGRVADGVIIGSRLVRLAAEAGDGQEASESVGRFLLETRRAIADVGRERLR